MSLTPRPAAGDAAKGTFAALADARGTFATCRGWRDPATRAARGTLAALNAPKGTLAAAVDVPKGTLAAAVGVARGTLTALKTSLSGPEGAPRGIGATCGEVL